MTFNREIESMGKQRPKFRWCDLSKHGWVGVLHSNVVSFRFAGNTRIMVDPPWWSLAWKRKGVRAGTLAVFIWPPEGGSVDDYRRETITLNGVEPRKVMRSYNPFTKKHYCLALFDKIDAVRSLGDAETGKWHTVVISGRLRTGEPFGGSQQVVVVP